MRIVRLFVMAETSFLASCMLHLARGCLSVPPLLRLAPSSATGTTRQKLPHVDEDHRPQYRHEEGKWKPARGHQGVENKNVDDHRRQHGHRQRHVTVGQQNNSCDDLKREDHPQVMRGIEGTHELSGNAPGGGRGMKFRKPFRPKTRKITPARYRAIAETVLITRFSFFDWGHYMT